MSRKLITKMVQTKNELKNIPVAANIDFGHTAPIGTFPIGGSMRIQIKRNDDVQIFIEEFLPKTYLLPITILRNIILFSEIQEV